MVPAPITATEWIAELFSAIKIPVSIFLLCEIRN